jgi:chromosome segregation ATPase
MPSPESHFLKRLELNGFKSFAGKTVLEFPAGIVAVVGPNGSGKSNIVDAVRWLLGERDAKNLRGAKVEDLIFAGTQKRARVGMAQASLYFENRNKFFPVDFEEVVVTRQISRDGASKYYLNKSEILLRDLIDFFAKARLGSRGLIIIGQGDSDLFIRSTPLERREMIEEILGLREYQIKKADAERRLKNSKINLDKVTALIEEIEPHLRSLKRQTSRWERRGALEEELRALENVFFGSQLHDLNTRGAQVDGRLSEHGKQFETLEHEKRAAETRQAAIEESQPEERKRLTKLKEDVGALMDSRSRLQKDVGRIEAQIEMAKRPSAAVSGGKGDDRAVEQYIDVLQKIKIELEEVLNEEPVAVLAAIETVLDEIADALEERPSTGRPSAAAANSAEAAIPDALRREFEAAARDLEEIEKNISSLREKEKGLEASQEDFYNTFKSAVADVQLAQGKLDAWEKVNRELQLEKERIDLRRQEVLHQIETAGRRADEFRENTSLEDAVAAAAASGFSGNPQDMEHRIFRLRGDLASMGEVDQALVKEAEDTAKRHEFLLKESGDLTKAVGDLTSLLAELNEKIKSEFEKSIHKINDEFDKFFNLMFDGGSAKLRVLKPKSERVETEADEDAGEGNNGAAGAAGEIEATEEELLMEKNGGVEIEVKMPRKKVTSLDMLSGGERSLVGIAALFAMVSVSPPPFLVLDEIDAPLDERNARRFGAMLKDFSKRTQFIVVTHNRATMEAANILYGVTLAEDGSSKVVSLKLEPEGEEKTT